MTVATQQPRWRSARRRSNEKSPKQIRRELAEYRHLEGAVLRLSALSRSVQHAIPIRADGATGKPGSVFAFPAPGFAIVSDVKINMHVLYYRDELGNSDLNRIGKPIAVKVVSSPFQWPPKDPNAPWFTCIDKVRGMVPLAALGPLTQ